MKNKIDVSLETVHTHTHTHTHTGSLVKYGAKEEVESTEM